MLKMKPTVFAVGKNYQIMVPVTGHSLFWVRVGDKCYYDESNGIMRSMPEIHRVTVPSCELDKIKHYTVCEREMIDRKPYFPETGDTVETEFDFCPVPKKGDVRAYFIADAHNHVETPVAAAKAFGDIDFLILGGDIQNHSGQVEYFDTIYDIAGQMTGGEKPVIFARGNHDLRGIYAEKFSDYSPQDNGNTYYTFKIGSIWGAVLDCGEDKYDDHPEYGLTVSCHCFRERQTEFVQSLDPDEYDAPDVTHKIVVVHNPFTHQLKPPFDIEAEIYSQWARILKETVKPDAMICGHLHRLVFSLPGSDFDHLGQPCPVVVGSQVDYSVSDDFIGTGLVFKEHSIEVTFNDNHGNIIETHCIPKNT